MRTEFTFDQINFIRYIVEGKREISEQEIAARLSRLHLDMSGNYYVAANLYVNYSNIPFSEKDDALRKTERLVRNHLVRHGIRGVCYTDTRENVIIVIISDEEVFNPAGITAVLKSLHDRLSNYHGLENYIGIGSPVRSFADISGSANDAFEMLAYKYQYGDSGIINISNLTFYKHNSGVGSDIYLERVLGCFKDADLGKMSTRLDELVEYVRNRPFVSNTSIRRVLIEVTVRILNIASESNVDVNEILGDRDPYHWILSQGHTEIITEWIMKLSSELLTKMLASREQTEKRTIYRAISYLHEHISDPDLGLEPISRAVNLSPSYLSNIFKKEMNIGLSSYLVTARIELAKAILKETDTAIQDIPGRIGFRSVSYFCSVFKKYAGTTPSQYRDDFIYATKNRLIK